MLEQRDFEGIAQIVPESTLMYLKETNVMKAGDAC